MFGPPAYLFLTDPFIYAPLRAHTADSSDSCVVYALEMLYQLSPKNVFPVIPDFLRDPAALTFIQGFHTYVTTYYLFDPGDESPWRGFWELHFNPYSCERCLFSLSWLLRAFQLGHPQVRELFASEEIRVLIYHLQQLAIKHKDAFWRQRYENSAKRCDVEIPKARL